VGSTVGSLSKLMPSSASWPLYFSAIASTKAIVSAMAVAFVSQVSCFRNGALCSYLQTSAALAHALRRVSDCGEYR